MLPPWLADFAYVLAAGRIGIGLGPFVAAGRLSRLLGFPTEHNTDSARLMARLFGVRDIGLGVLVAYCARDPHALWLAALLNVFMDGGDLLSAAVPLVAREGIARGALMTGAFALGGLTCWIVLMLLIGSGS
jgi:hypothetical protein